MHFLKKDKAYIWHPFTQMKDADDPILIERAEGSFLYGSNGKAYLDAISSWWVNLHGHAHPYIAERIARQARELEHVLFAGFTHRPAIELAEKLLELLPASFSKVFYSDNGSTAVEVSIKMALQYWYNKGQKDRTGIIALEGAYHGDTFGAMAAGARTVFTAPFQSQLFFVNRIPVPTGKNQTDVLAAFTQLVKTGKVAAFIYEPLVQGAAGMQMYKPAHLDPLLAIARTHGVLCIADEVMTGFGRTGRNFASGYLLNNPDIICLSKGITGGFMPLGATVCTEAVFAAFYAEEAEKTFFHGHSYTANPLACAAAVASLELLAEPSCQQNIHRICVQHAKFVSTLRGHSFVKDVRQCGTIVAVELNTTEGSSYFHSLRKEAYRFCMDRGVLLRPLGNILYCLPPYCITTQELELVYKTITEALDFLKDYD